MTARYTASSGGSGFAMVPTAPLGFLVASLRGLLLLGRPRSDTWREIGRLPPRRLSGQHAWPAVAACWVRVGGRGAHFALEAAGGAGAVLDVASGPIPRMAARLGLGGEGL